MTVSENSGHEAYWPRIKAHAEAHDGAALQNLVRSVGDPKERVALWRFIIRCLAFREWKRKSLDLLIEVGDDAIDEMERFAGDFPEESVWFAGEANMTCYNMAANLADCWGDDFERQARHFEKGLGYAEKTIRYRHELDKGPGALNMGFWVKGKHELSLRRFDAARESLKRSLDFAIDDAKAKGEATGLTGDAPYAVILGYGFLAIAEMATGKPSGETQYESAIACFEEFKSRSEEAKAEAETGIDSLRISLQNLMLDD